MPQIFDHTPFIILLTTLLVTLLLTYEIGHQWTHRRTKRNHNSPTPASTGESNSHVGVLLGALLGLLGLMLGFTFHTCESRFQNRKQLILTEANTLSTTYLRAGLLPDPLKQSSRALLRRYLETRTQQLTPATLPELLAESVKLQRKLWIIAEDADKRDVTNTRIPLFISSLNELIDLHQNRVTVGLQQRMPGALILTLIILSGLSSFVLGYGTGLLKQRFFPLPVAILSALSLVITLIIDLDRPWQQMFHVVQDPMLDVSTTFSSHP